MFDSVFSQFVEKPYSSETTIIPERQIKQQLNKLEKKAIALFTNSYQTYLDNAITDILNKDDPVTAINNYQWSFKNELAKNLWGEWLLGLGAGDKHGEIEIKTKGKLEVDERGKKNSGGLQQLDADTHPLMNRFQDPLNFNSFYNVAEFKQPEAEPAIIRNIPAEKAIKERANKLASDVNNSEWREIQSALLDAVKPTSPTTPPISRAELLKRINQALGDKKNRFASRAEGIARTELTFAYNVGRLNSYIQSGLVEAVKFISILDGRRCKRCESRHGLIVKLDNARELARIMPPIHPKCRCVISPVLATEFKTEGQKKQRQVKNRTIITNTAPWLMAGILAAILLGRKTPIQTAVKIAEKIKDIAEIGVAKEVQKATSSKEQVTTKESRATKVPQQQKKVKEPLRLDQTKLPVNPIFLTPQIDLQTATFEDLRSLFTKKQLSDKLIQDILNYRDTNGLVSIDDLRNVLGISELQLSTLQRLNNNNQIFPFLDPRPNSTAINLWVRSGGILTKQQARTIKKIITSVQFKSIEELEAVLKQNNIDDKIIADLKQMARLAQQREIERIREIERQRQLAESRVVVGRALPPARSIQGLTPAQIAIRRTGNQTIRNVNSSIANAEAEISLLRSRIELNIRQVQRRSEVQEIINQSSESVAGVRSVSVQLANDVDNLNLQVNTLNSRLKSLQDKLAALLNPNVEDYFQARPRVITEIQNEIQNIRAQINDVNRFTNVQTRAANTRSKELTRVQKIVKAELPNYSSAISTIENQLTLIARQLDIEAIRGDDSVAVSYLRSRYRELNNQLISLKGLQNNPLQQYAEDKKIISNELGSVKRKTRNLSNRLSTLESKIEELPARIVNLSPSTRKAYRKLRTSITRRVDYETPIRAVPGTQGRQARLAKAARLQRQATIDNQFDSIIATAEDLIGNADSIFLNNRRQGRTTVKQQIENFINQYSENRQNIASIKQNLAINARQVSNEVVAIENQIDNLVKQVQDDVYDVLADDWFNDRGFISNQSRKKTLQAKKQINQSINNIDNQLNTLESARNRTNQLKAEIESLADTASRISIDSRARLRLNQQIQRLFAELDGLNRFEVNSSYFNSKINQYKNELTSIINGESFLLKSKVKTVLDDIVADVNDLTLSLNTANNAGVIATLNQAKERLIQQRNRINNLPKRIANIPISAQNKWRENRSVRGAVKKANKKLNDSINSYRQETSLQINNLNKLSENIDSNLGDILDSDAYKQLLDSAIKEQQGVIKVAIAELDDNLKLLELATNKERGLELIYSDLKKIYQSDIPGLINVTGGTFPVGLDEAVEVKRQVIKFLQERGKKLQNQINIALNSDKARTITRYKLAIIDNQIKELENIQRTINITQKYNAGRVRKNLSNLFQADPVFYKELNPTNIIGEIQENTFIQKNIINKQLAALRTARTILNEDLQRQLTYSIREKQIIELINGIPKKTTIPTATLTKQQIKAELKKYSDTVENISKTRRQDFEQIGLFLKYNRIKLYGKNSISYNLKTNRPLTQGQQKAFDKLQPYQQNLLREASRVGVLDLYDDLYKLSVVKQNLEDDVIENVNSIFAKLGITDSKRIKKVSLKSKKYQDVMKHLSRLQGAGYQGLRIEISPESAKFIGLNKPPRSLADRQQWELLLRKLGVGRDGEPLPISNIKITAIANGTLTDYTDVTYNEVLKAIATNRQLRYEINNRLSAFNFNKFEKDIRYFNLPIS